MLGNRLDSGSIYGVRSVLAALFAPIPYASEADLFENCFQATIRLDETKARGLFRLWYTLITSNNIWKTSAYRTVAKGAPMSEAVDHLGQYELREELGRGAMARVWRAWDPNLGREVAIKEPLFDASLSESVLDEMGSRFVREAKTAANLNHPGIVTIYAADVYDGRPAIVMELVEGSTLGDILEQNGKLSPDAALDALKQLLDAVGYAHGQGVVHRDIKPENIFVSNDGKVKLADFGIAHVDDGRATRATAFGTVLGTPGYMSPEQARGGTVDARSDLFSIAVVAYEMISGRNPFGAGDGSDPTTLLYRIVHEPVPELPENASAGLPADVRPAIMAALSKDPAARPQSAAMFKAMLIGTQTPPSHTQFATGPAAIADQAAAGHGASNANTGRAPKWLPYVAIALACAVVLAVVFVNATSGGGGGSRGSVVNGTSAASSIQTSSTATEKYFLAIGPDDYVAVYAGKIGDGSNPERVTDVLATDLSPDSVEELEDGLSFDSLKEANAQVKKYRAEAESLASNASSSSSAEKSTAKTPATQPRFEFRAGSHTWSEARRLAEEAGGHLAVVTNQAEWDAVLAVMPPEEITVCWLGARRSGSDKFEWVNGKPFSFNRWASNEPNNEDGSEDCLCALKANSVWGWYDVPNDVSPYYAPHRMGYIIEFD